jgi:hypothetical protein
MRESTVAALKKKAKRKRRFAFPARVHTEARVRTEGCVSAV